MGQREVQIINDAVELVPIESLKLHPRNPRRGNVDVIRESINVNGFFGLVIVQKSTRHILSGNHTCDAAVAAGMKMIPVVWIDCDDDRALRILLASNRANDLATYDDGALGSLLAELSETQAGLLGSLYDADAVAAMLAPATMNSAEDPGPQLDKAEELQKKWGTALGQLWEIPSVSTPACAHRALCGDSTRLEDVRRLMGGRRAKLFATDPPYLVGYDAQNHPSAIYDSHGKKKPKAEIENKNKDWHGSYGFEWDDADIDSGLYDGFIRVAKEAAIEPGAIWFCWHATKLRTRLEAIWERHGVLMHQQIVWTKSCPVLCRLWYMTKHESCLMGWLKGNAPKAIGRTEYPPDVWEFPNKGDDDKIEHPTVKPIGVFAIPMRQHTQPGDICYEPFCGSGSQIVAAEQTGRVCYALEIEPRYVAVTLERLAGMGLTPKLVEDGPA